MNILHFVILAHIALGLSTLSLGMSIYAIWRSKRAVTTNHIALVAAATNAAATGSTPIVNCANCSSAVARYSLTSKGPVCANCKPL